MDTMPRPLPRSLDPLPGEALPGYLLRLAHRLEQFPAQGTTITGLTRPRTFLIPGRLLLQLSTAETSRFCHACRLTPREATGLCLTSPAGRSPPLDLTIRELQSPPRQPGLWLRQARGSPGWAAGCSPPPPGIAPPAWPETAAPSSSATADHGRRHGESRSSSPAPFTSACSPPTALPAAPRPTSQVPALASSAGPVHSCTPLSVGPSPQQPARTTTMAISRHAASAWTTTTPAPRPRLPPISSGSSTGCSGSCNPTARTA